MRGRGHPGQLPGLAAEHPAPQSQRVLAEQVVGLGRYDEPGALADLDLELLLTPPGVPGEDPQAGQRRRDDLGRRVQVDDPHVGVQPAEADRLDVRVDAVGGRGGHRQRGVGADRAALEEHVRLAGHVGPVGQHLADRHRGRPVEDDAERAVLVEVQHEHDGALEVGVEQGRRGDQQVTDAQAHDPVGHGQAGAVAASEVDTRELASAA
jgi:hypothetical protein